VVIIRIKNFLLDLFSPKFCLGCGLYGVYICDNCANKISFLEVQKCPTCRRDFVSGKFCRPACAKTFYFDQLLVCLEYKRGSLFQKLMVRFKYKFSEDLCDFLGNILVIRFRVFESLTPYSREICVVPVPIHKQKLKKRGFNQTKLLADFFCKSFPKMIPCDCLRRTICHIEQAKLGRKERLTNLKGAIDLKEGFKDKIKGKFVLLIDDVSTTGSTLDECSKVLKENGAKYVCGLVLARG
jgi:ComF family protein